MNRSIEKGLNSDILHKGFTFHIQTEDLGRLNPFIVTQVFLKGKVVKQIKIPYSKVLPKGENSDAIAVRTALEFQHQSILDLLVSGQLGSF